MFIYIIHHFIFTITYYEVGTISSFKMMKLRHRKLSSLSDMPAKHISNSSIFLTGALTIIVQTDARCHLDSCNPTALLVLPPCSCSLSSQRNLSKM